MFASFTSLACAELASLKQSSAHRDANKSNLICFSAMLGSGSDPCLSDSDGSAHCSHWHSGDILAQMLLLVTTKGRMRSLNVSEA